MINSAHAMATKRILLEGKYQEKKGWYPRFAVVDAEDYPLVEPYRWNLRVDRQRQYAVTTIKEETPEGIKHRHVGMHRILLPGFPIIDHRDGDGLNNRRRNLRPCTRAENRYNSRKHVKFSSRYKGVSCLGWVANIRANGKHYSLGTFRNEKDAALAYDEAARRLHGEFARLNFPDVNPTSNIGHERTPDDE